MSRSIISTLQPVSWPLASRSSQQVAREQRRPDNAFARTPSPTVVVVVVFCFWILNICLLKFLIQLWLWLLYSIFACFSICSSCDRLFLLFAISFVSIFAFVFAGVCVFVCVSVSLPESSGLWWRKVCQRARESRCSAVASPSPVKRTLRIGSHTCLLQRWRWWTPCSKSSSTRRGRRREACGGFRTSSLFQFQRGECCCKASCCTNRYHTPAESRSRLIK